MFKEEKKMKQGKLFALLIILRASLTLPALAANPHEEYVQGPFENGPDVTKGCLECHEDQATEFIKTCHWTW